MKLILVVDQITGAVSCPARGTWIEMPTAIPSRLWASRSCPARGTWIEILTNTAAEEIDGRAPQGARGLKLRAMQMVAVVVPRKGHVD